MAKLDEDPKRDWFVSSPYVDAYSGGGESWLYITLSHFHEHLICQADEYGEQAIGRWALSCLSKPRPKYRICHEDFWVLAFGWWCDNPTTESKVWCLAIWQDKQVKIIMLDKVLDDMDVLDDWNVT